METYYVSSCANNPDEFWVGVVAYLSSAQYTDAEDMDLTLSDQNTFYVSWTFPDLIVTLLTPGELIEMVLSHSYINCTNYRNGIRTSALLSLRSILRTSRRCIISPFFDMHIESQFLQMQ